MPDQKISQLTAIVTVDNSADVLPIVDISANTTKKVTPTQLKTALALDNVNNTSDANKPVSTAQQDALNAKVNSNAAITPGTAAKITFDAKGLVTSGNSLDESDLPTGINANKIGTGVVSTTEFEYLNGVTSAIQTQIDSKQATLVSGTNIKTVNSTSLLGSGDIAVQATLVSGTNIKTINSTSLLGSGDIVISASPSGVSGAIQFSNGSAFASDASNLFWDDTNNRLGIGTNAPTQTLDVNGVSNFRDTVRIGVSGRGGSVTWGGGFFMLNSSGTDGSSLAISDTKIVNVIPGSLNTMINTTTDLGAKLGIRGSGSTSATTSLLVQNSAGTAAMTVRDDRSIGLNAATQMCFADGTANNNAGIRVLVPAGFGVTYIDGYSDGSSKFANYPIYFGSRVNNTGSATTGASTAENGTPCVFGSAVSDASALVQINATTRGFLPPRMTTTQKNAIATPASGLVVYDNTTNKLCCYNGSTWNDLF